MRTLRWTWYLFRLVAYSSAGILRFLSRKNTRIFGVLLVAASGYLLRDTLHGLIIAQLRAIDPGYRPETWLLDVGTGILTFIACFAYSAVTGIVALIMSSFRLGRRPLPPMRKLKATKAKVTSAVVRIVVPPLPKRRN